MVGLEVAAEPPASRFVALRQPRPLAGIPGPAGFDALLSGLGGSAMLARCQRAVGVDEAL